MYYYVKNIAIFWKTIPCNILIKFYKRIELWICIRITPLLLFSSLEEVLFSMLLIKQYSCVDKYYSQKKKKRKKERNISINRILLFVLGVGAGRVVMIFRHSLEPLLNPPPLLRFIHKFNRPFYRDQKKFFKKFSFFS